MATVATASAGEAVGQHAAAEVRPELGSDPVTEGILLGGGGEEGVEMVLEGG